MQLSELLGLPVVDSAGGRVGTVVDVRLCVPGDIKDNPGSPTVFGIVVSPHTKSSYLGYERGRADRPRLLAALLRWRHRGTFLALWRDIARLADDRVTLREGATNFSPVLRRG